MAKGLLRKKDDFDPKEIQAFKEGYQLARQFFYQKDIFNSLLEDAKGNPVNAIAGLVVTALLRVQDSVGDLSLTIAGALGIALIDDLADALEQSGAVENTPELQGQVLTQAVALWLQSNDYPPDQVASMLENMDVPKEMTQQIRQAGKQQQPTGQQPAKQPPMGAM